MHASDFDRDSPDSLDRNQTQPEAGANGPTEVDGAREGPSSSEIEGEPPPPPPSNGEDAGIVLPSPWLNPKLRKCDREKAGMWVGYILRWALNTGFWPVVIAPKGAQIKTRQGDREAKGKEPVGKAWGLNRLDEEKLRLWLKLYPKTGAGLCLGPGRAPGGLWLIDLEIDGEHGLDSLQALFGGEIPPTLGWSSTRGSHFLFIADGDRLLSLLAAAGAREGKGLKAGVWHLPLFPDLEWRIGGFKGDGSTIKQVQSVIPPTVGDDGQP